MILHIIKEHKKGTQMPIHNIKRKSLIHPVEEWWLDGNRHRTDGPAYRTWYENGELECEEWWLDGNRHRTDGPAYRPWYENGQPRSEGWYLDGKEYTKENYWKKMFEMVKQGEIKKTVDMEVNGLSALI